MMNTYNNGTAALKMPSSYVPMGTEEMEYVDGGSEGTYRKQAQQVLRVQLSKLTPEQRRAAEKQGWNATATVQGWVLSTISLGLAIPTGGASLLIAGIGYCWATVSMGTL